MVNEVIKTAKGYLVGIAHACRYLDTSIVVINLGSHV